MTKRRRRIEDLRVVFHLFYNTVAMIFIADLIGPLESLIVFGSPECHGVTGDISMQ